MNEWICATTRSVRVCMEGHPNTHTIKELERGRWIHHLVLWLKKAILGKGKRGRDTRLIRVLFLDYFNLWLYIIRAPHLGFILCFTIKLVKEIKITI